MKRTSTDALRVDRTCLRMTTRAEAEREDREYWFSRTPQERLGHLEALREMNYGPEVLNQRLQRILAASLSRQQARQRRLFNQLHRHSPLRPPRNPRPLRPSRPLSRTPVRKAPRSLAATRTEPSEHSSTAKRISILAPPARNSVGVIPKTLCEFS